MIRLANACQNNESDILQKYCSDEAEDVIRFEAKLGETFCGRLENDQVNFCCQVNNFSSWFS